MSFDAAAGAEIQKTRPALVVSSDAVGVLPVKLVAPLTGWSPSYANHLWHVEISPDSRNGLTKRSAVDVLQMRGVDLQRFIHRIGRASAALLDEVAAAIAAVVEYT